MGGDGAECAALEGALADAVRQLAEERRSHGAELAALTAELNGLLEERFQARRLPVGIPLRPMAVRVPPAASGPAESPLAIMR